MESTTEPLFFCEEDASSRVISLPLALPSIIVLTDVNHDNKIHDQVWHDLNNNLWQFSLYLPLDFWETNKIWIWFVASPLIKRLSLVSCHLFPSSSSAGFINRSCQQRNNKLSFLHLRCLSINNRSHLRAINELSPILSFSLGHHRGWGKRNSIVARNIHKLSD